MIIMSLIKLARRFPHDDGLARMARKRRNLSPRISGDAGMLRYNSKLPIVVYTPDNVDVEVPRLEGGREN